MTLDKAYIIYFFLGFLFFLRVYLLLTGYALQNNQKVTECQDVQKLLESERLLTSSLRQEVENITFELMFLRATIITSAVYIGYLALIPRD